MQRKIGENSLKKRIGILFDRLRWEEKELARQFEVRGVSAELIDAKTLALDLSSNHNDSLPEIVLERCVSFYRGFNLASTLEGRGITVLNSSRGLEICGNKLLTSQLLSKHNVLTPRTIVAFSAESALEAVERIGYPCVMKPIVGSWGRQVVPIRDRETAEALIEMREQRADSMNSIFYIQEMVKRPPRDIRCITVGSEIVTSVYRYAPENSWKTNVALGGHSEPCLLSAELEETLLCVAEAIEGENILGIDVMETQESRYVVHEVNGTVEFRGAQQASSQSIAGKIAEYVLRKIVSGKDPIGYDKSEVQISSV